MSQCYNKKTKKRNGQQRDGNAKKVKYSGPLEYYLNTKVTSGKWIDVHKWIQGAFIAHGKDFGLVAQRIELNPGAETTYIVAACIFVRWSTSSFFATALLQLALYRATCCASAKS